MDTEESWYRVIDRRPSNAGPFWQIRLHPEDWKGRDLILLISRGSEQTWGLDSLHYITPQQRAAWREAGTLV